MPSRRTFLMQGGAGAAEVVALGAIGCGGQDMGP
jgi:hypothetical protein